MNVAIYEDVVVNTTFAGRHIERSAEKVPGKRVILFVRDVPEATPVDEVVRRVASAVKLDIDGFQVAPDKAWPQEVRSAWSEGADLNIGWSDLR